jgi:two-component system, NtrC family, sensor kinase
MLVEIKSSSNGRIYPYILNEGTLKKTDLNHGCKLQYSFYCHGYCIKTSINLNEMKQYDKKNVFSEISARLKIIHRDELKSKKSIVEKIKSSENEIITNKEKKIESIFNYTQKQILLKELLNTLRHEITNPVTGIKLAAKYLSIAPQSKEIMNLGESIYDSTDKVTNLIEQQDKTKCYSIKTIINEIIFNLKSSQPSVNFHIDLEKDYIIKNNKQLFEQIIINIIENAIQAMKKKKKININIKSSYINEKFHLHIQDNGPLPEDETKIFLPFYTTKKEGSGLGLFICKKYCKELGLSLRFEKMPTKQFIISDQS